MPGTNGSAGLSWYWPLIISVSAKLSPAARTRMRTSPGPGSGSGLALQHEAVQSAQLPANDSTHTPALRGRH